MECFRLLLEHLAWIEYQFLSGIRDSRKVGSWLAKQLRLGLGLLCWGFKGVQEEIPWEEASTLQIGSVAFPPRQCTSLQLHPCHRLFWPRWASRQFLPLLIVQTSDHRLQSWNSATEQIWYHLCAIWTVDSVVEFRLCNLWSLVRSPVVEIAVYTADET